jgi:hypothetical protein
VVALIATASWAQVATADLHVTVKDQAGAVVREATVTVTNQATGATRSSTSNVEGEYQFRSLQPGRYEVGVNAAGFAKTIARDVVITVGQLAELPITLQLATVTETVDVSAEAALVETQRTTVATTVDETRIDNLPINGRNYINFALTNSQLARDTAPSIGAAPTSGLNVGGQRARANLVNVDGLDAVDNSTNGIRSTVSQEAVQEFQLITNGYTAEYGRASGGIVNIITKGGTNDFHGSVFGFLRNRNIQATNPFSTIEKPGFTRTQAGFTAGGRIKKDRTFWFLSYELTRRNETGFSNIGADNYGLSANADITRFVSAALGSPLPPGLVNVPVTPQQKVVLDGLPVAPATVPYALLIGTSGSVALTGQNPLTALIPGLGPGFFAPTASGQFDPLPASYATLNSIVGNYPIHEETDLWSLRFDHRLTDNQILTVRGGWSPSYVTGIQVNAQGPQNFGQNAWSRTSEQNYRDWTGTAQHSWTIGTNKVNEFRFQYARRGLLYNYSSAPGGQNVAVNIPGFAFLGREPFSFVKRTETRYQFVDNFTWSVGRHSIKFGGDVNYLPLKADFTVNFGGIYNFGQVDVAPGLPGLTPIQAYGAGLPQVFIQGVGNQHDEFSNKVFAGFVQDSWRVSNNLTLNYGVRYDVELTPTFPATTSLAQAAQDALGITQGIPRDFNNFAPRVGLAWDPWSDGKTVIRASYGLFYDHPLLGLAFDSDVADGSQAPQIVLFGGRPTGCELNAANAFTGRLSCLDPSFTYISGEQRFNPAPGTQSIWTNQNFLPTSGGAPVPLALLPFGFPTSRDFEYAYSNQANLTFERDLGHDISLSLQYNFNGGRHLNRPINTNTTVSELLVQNWYNAMTDPALTPAQKAAFSTNPLLVNVGGVNVANPTNPLPYIPPALVSFFRPSGLNPTLAYYQSPATIAFADQILSAYGLGLPGTPECVNVSTVCVPFSDMPANFSSGSSVYHGLTANLRKRFSKRYEFLASYTWSKAIDDSTDLESPLSPQNSYNPDAERSVSLFDQRHRFVFSGVYQMGKISGGVTRALFSDWTFAPMIEFASGRPFNIISGFDQNFDLTSGTDRPKTAVAGQTDACNNTAVASEYSPTGYLIPACFADIIPMGGVMPVLNGDLSRNAGIRPMTILTDLRVSRRFYFNERVHLEGSMDVFNLINRFNVADVNPLWNQAGTPTAAFDPRQFQFGLRLAW